MRTYVFSRNLISSFFPFSEDWNLLRYILRVFAGVLGVMSGDISTNAESARASVDRKKRKLNRT